VQPIGELRVKAPAGSSGVTRCSCELREVEGQQVADIGAGRTLWQLGEHMQEIGVRLDVAGPSGERRTVDRRARFRAGNGVTEQL
jgi:hypothetical protein